MATGGENGMEVDDINSDFDIEALINGADVDEKDVSEVVSSLHEELNAVNKIQQEETPPPTNTSTITTTLSSTLSSSVSPPPLKEPPNSNGVHVSVQDTGGVKTKGEASNTHGLTLNLSSSSSKTTISTTSQQDDSSSSRRPSLSTMSPFATTLTPVHNPQVQLLTQEEQSAIYKQASLFAIYSMSNKNGATKAKEMLAVVTKVKNFLTNLVQLAGNSGPAVKSTVHSLVQKLVAGSITEKEFAEKIEQDLKSKHQPDLLPFLQSSIPELRTHLQIQKEYMKQLVDKKVQEKQSSATGGGGASTSSGGDQEVTPPTQLMTTPTTTTGNDKTNTQLLGKSSVGGAQGGGVINLTSLGVTLSQQQALKAHLANLPEDQRRSAIEKFLYNKQLQLLIQKQKNSLKSMTTTTPTSSANNTAIKLTSTQQQLSILVRQQQRIKEQQQQASLALGGGGGVASTSNMRASPRKTGLTSLIGKLKPSPTTTSTGAANDDSNIEEQPSTHNTTAAGGSSSKGKVQDEEEEDDAVENIAGVNLKEETAHFLPTTAVIHDQSCTDETFLSTAHLKTRVQSIGYKYGITDVSDEYLTFLSHATEERLKNLIEQVTAISQHRSKVFKEDSRYDQGTDVRGQLKVLERIDELSTARKQEREKEKILRAARSRSKQDDPEIAKMKEQAKQIQIAEEREIHQKAANTLALAAIGRRKRTAATAGLDTTSNGDTPSTSSTGGVVGGATLSGGGGGSGTSNSASLAAVFNTPSPSRGSSRHKQRRILTKDVLLTMEQERETRHSLLVYKTHIN